MPTERPASIRTIAEACRLSTATVSRALAGLPSVKPGTVKHVMLTAKRLGYQRNSLVGTLMSQLRVSRGMRFQGNLAIVHVPSVGQPKLLPTQQRIINGARSRATELGFKIDVFTLGADGLSSRRLGQVLYARGVTGLIIIYSDPSTATADFPWEKFTAVEIDFGEREPWITTVCVDHYHTFMGALKRLHELGYRRMGLFLERFKDDRIWYRYTAAFHAFQANTLPDEPLPPLVTERMNSELFLAWYRAHLPDLVIGHVDEAIVWLRDEGVKVPATTAFFNLNWTARKRNCAGLNLLPESQGILAAESVIAQIHRHECGLPAVPKTIMLRGKWMDGPTLRRVRVRARARKQSGRAP